MFIRLKSVCFSLFFLFAVTRRAAKKARMQMERRMTLTWPERRRLRSLTRKKWRRKVEFTVVQYVVMLPDI